MQFTSAGLVPSPFHFGLLTFTELKLSDFQILHWSIWHILAMQWKSNWFRVGRRRQFSARTIQQGINIFMFNVYKPSILFVTVNL